MVTAIVMVQAERARIPETAALLAQVKFVKEVYSVTGDWDIVAILKLPSYEHLDEIVTAHLRKLPGLLKTQTMLAFRAYSDSALDEGFGIGLGN